MAGGPEEGAAAAAPAALRAGPGARRAPVARGWARLVDGLGALGTVLIGVLMVIICAEVVVRNAFGGSLPMVAELGALTLVMIVYLSLATTIRHDRLARTEFLFAAIRRRSPRAGRLLGALFDATTGAAFGLVAWSTLGILEKDYGRGEYIGVTGIATLPTWPFRVLILVGVTIAAVQCAVQVAAALRGEDAS